MSTKQGFDEIEHTRCSFCDRSPDPNRSWYIVSAIDHHTYFLCWRCSYIVRVLTRTGDFPQFMDPDRIPALRSADV